MRTTDQFFALIEKTFNVDEITPRKIMEEFYNAKAKVRWGRDRKGKQRFGKSKATLTGQSVMEGIAQELSQGGNLYNRIKDINVTSPKARKILGKIREEELPTLSIHRDEIKQEINSKLQEVIGGEKVRISKEKAIIRQRLIDQFIGEGLTEQEALKKIIKEKLVSREFEA